MKRILYSLLLFSYPLISSCQPITINGKIINEDGKPVPNATITIKHSNKKTISDHYGLFTIHDSRLTDTLIVTAVGYETTEEPNNERGLITITLKWKIKMLSEIVLNTGYQLLSPERTTGSYAQLTEKDLWKRSEPGILDRLNGTIAAVSFPGKLDAPSLMVRGLSTINGPKSPLIVIDNFPYEGDLGNINPDDVESMTVLKDAAAASVWGTKAGNGVVVITTKKGKFNTPLKIRYNASVTVTAKPDLFYVPVMSSSSFIDVEEFLFSKGYYNSEINNSSHPALSPVVELLIKKANGQLAAADADAQINRYRDVDIRNEFNKYFYRSALNTQHTIDWSGGSGTNSYLFTFGYDKSVSDLSSTYDRYNLRAENSFRPFRNFQFDVALAFTQSRDEASGKPAYNSIRVGARQIPYLLLADDNGNPLPVATNYREGYTDTAGAGRLLNWKYYPLTDFEHTSGITGLQDLALNLTLHYNFSKALKLDVLYQLQRQQSSIKVMQDTQSYYTRNLINHFSQVNSTTGAIKYNVPLGAILNQLEESEKSQNLRAQLNYNNSWKKAKLSAMAGAEIRQVNFNASGNKLYGYNDDLLTYAKVDYVNPYPDYITGSSSYIPDGTSLSDVLNHFVSCYSNLAFTWEDRYTLSASARKDASNLFGVNTNDKWNPLWSAGAAWLISKEKFYPFTFLPFLRLRMTYGFSGNVDQGRSALTTVRYTTTAQYTNFQMVGVNQYANPDLRWEKVGQFNVALDFGTKNDRITGSIEYYRKKAVDLFGPSLIDYTVGIGSASVTRNIASMKAGGLELTLDAAIIDRVFKWNSRLIGNYFKDKTLSYYQTGTLARNFVNNGNTISPLQGYSLYDVISYQWAGLDSAGAPRGYLNKNLSTNYGSITGSGNPLSELVYKNALPRFYGAWMNTFSWRKLAVSVNIIYKFGYYFRRSSVSYTTLYSSGAAHADFEKRWQNPGDELHTSVPAMMYPLVSNRDAFYLGSEVLVEKGDHIRLQFISLSYDAGKVLLRKNHPGNIAVFLTASDLGIIWRANKQGIDPDYGDNIPSSRRLTLGCKLDF